MKNFIIVALLIIIGCVAYANYKNGPKTNFKLGESNKSTAMTTPNGKYSYKTMDNETLKYLKGLGGGSLYANRSEYPKVFLYINVTDTTCPYRRNFQRKIHNYSDNMEWARHYKFNYINVHQSETRYFNSPNEYNAYVSFMNNCDFFCIIDFEKNAIFHGERNSDEYVKDVITSFAPEF